MKYSKFIAFLLFAFLLLNTQCNEDDVSDEYDPGCNALNVLIDNTEYQTAESDFYSITGYGIDIDCLIINFSASGCSGDTWVLNLIDSEDVLESFPPQRNLRLVLNNDEACLAVFSQTRVFDLRELQVNDANEVILNIEGIDEEIVYSY